MINIPSGDFFNALQANGKTPIYRAVLRPIASSSVEYAFCTSWPRNLMNLGYQVLIPIELVRRVEVENCRFALSTFLFDLLDHPAHMPGNVFVDNVVTELADQLVGYMCQLFMGFWELPWFDSNVLNNICLFTGIVTEMSQGENRYRFTARSTMAAANDKTLFAGAATKLIDAVGTTDTTFHVEDASEFESASATTPRIIQVGTGEAAQLYEYDGEGQLGDETWNLSPVFRSATGGFLVPPQTPGTSKAHEERSPVYEVPYIGLLSTEDYTTNIYHPLRIFHDTLVARTGKVGIAEAGVPANGNQLSYTIYALGSNIQFRFAFREGVSAKKFLEEEICAPVVGYPFENNLGQIGVKLFGIPNNGGPQDISDADILSRPKWLRNSQRTVTTVIFHYDYMPHTREYLATYTYRDQALIASIGREITLEIFSKGLRSPVILDNTTVAMTSNYAFRMAGVINHTLVPSTQTNIPVYVEWTHNDFRTFANGGFLWSASGFDIVPHLDAALTVKIDAFDLVKYDPATGKVAMWIKIDSLSSSLDTTIYFGFSASLASTAYQGNRSSVWSNGYVAVFHLNEKVGMSIADSSGNGNTGTKKTTGEPGISGFDLVVGGLDFDGGDDYINCGSQASLDNPSALTVEVVIHPQGMGGGGFGRIFQKGDGAGGENYRLQLAGTGQIEFATGDNTDQVLQASVASTVSINTTQHYAVTWDGGVASSGIHIYKNNSEVSYDGALTQEGTTVPDTSAVNFWIGNRQDGTRAFDGIIEMLRLSNSVRSADWLTVQYNSVFTGFFTRGVTETIFGGSITTYYGATPDFLAARGQAYVDRFKLASPILQVEMPLRKCYLEVADEMGASFTNVPNVAQRTMGFGSLVEIIAQRYRFQDGVIEMELMALPSTVVNLTDTTAFGLTVTPQIS